jgi:hypothetical protein
MDVRKESRQSSSVPLVKRLYPELACFTLGQAIEQGKQRVLEPYRKSGLATLGVLEREHLLERVPPWEVYVRKRLPEALSS